ncbi:hypothetical protein CBP20_04285 [Fischerella thermalis WC213]|nr:hypothetical protein CBP20_04285 [Fischerella thermalis WC213]
MIIQNKMIPIALLFLSIFYHSYNSTRKQDLENTPADEQQKIDWSKCSWMATSYSQRRAMKRLAH